MDSNFVSLGLCRTVRTRRSSLDVVDAQALICESNNSKMPSTTSWLRLDWRSKRERARPKRRRVSVLEQPQLRLLKQKAAKRRRKPKII